MAEIPNNPEQIDQLLVNLKLRRMRQILMRELALATETSCSYGDFLKRLLHEEWLDRQERSDAYRLEKANIPEQWEIETFPFDRQPGVHAAQIRELANLDFIAEGRNLVFIGETGTGKTGLATGLLLKAVRAGRRGMFVKAQDLFEEMYASLADRTTRGVVNRLARLDLLHIDELGYLNLRPEQANVFFKLMEERYTNHKATMITTNIEYDDWHRHIGNEPMTKALLGRLRHRCTTIRITGPTLRTPTG